ncbi:hypothetical protein O0L34_g15454 [Tuta absoluta]|nr:hypothetical protein O0L34_g15454 [Tuta absoluta]
MALNDFDAISNIPPYLLNILSRPGSGRTIKPVNDGDSTKRGKTRKKKNSPYLFGDKVQLISRVTTEKKVQRQSEIYSSFPLANNLYRASSDEFKALKKIRRKARKSVLTLPNVPAPMPNACTVSDMNDSDYYKNEKKIKSTKRYSKPRTRGIEFFDRDAHRFESSSHNMLLKNGDGKAPFSQAKGKYHEDMQDVWSVLRNINKFQFRSKHLVSDEDSLISARNKKNTRKFRTRKGRRLIGTCRTEEVAYVADFEIQSKSASRSSSFDRITVIDKIDLQNETNLKNNVVKVQSPRRIPYKPKKMIPLNENNKKVPNAKVSQVKDNRFLANTKKQNDQMNKVVNKTAANVNLKQPESESVCTFEKSIDSSNCLRMFNNEPSDCSFIFNDKEDTLRNIINNQAFSSNKNTNGLIKTAFNNSNTKINHQINKGPLKPRLVTTMPSAATMPKPAAADIKRKLTQLKFPIVVLDKDEISSTVEVFDYEPPQFSGLNNHIWPFMLGWKNKQTSKKGSSQRFPESITGHERKANNDVALARSKDRKTPNLNFVSKKDMDSKRGIQIQQELSISPDGLKKIKPMRQFKDKMLKLLYKNSYPSNIKLCQNAEPVKVISDLKVKVDAGTEMTVERKYIHEKPKNIVRGNTHIATIATATLPRSTLTAPTVGRVGNEEQNIIPKKHDGITDDAGKSCNSLQAQNRRIPGTRPPWAKAKWASDFIENVIRKIKNGSYYGTEERRPPVDKTVNLTNKTVQIQEDRKCDGK